MKKIILIVAALGYSVISVAQNKGDKFLGLYFSLEGGKQKTELESGNMSTEEKKDLDTEFGIGAEFSYFVNDNFKVSLALSYGYESSPTVQTGDSWKNTKVGTFEITPSLSYYFQLADKFYYTPELGVSFGFGNISYPVSYAPGTSLSYDCKGFSIYGHLAAFEYKVTQRFSIGLAYGTLSYGKITMDVDDNNTLKVNAFEYNFKSMSFNVRFYL